MPAIAATALVVGEGYPVLDLDTGDPWEALRCGRSAPDPSPADRRDDCPRWTVASSPRCVETVHVRLRARVLDPKAHFIVEPFAVDAMSRVVSGVLGE
jgi:hypothetical protein